MPNCATNQFTFDVNVTDAGVTTVDISTNVHGLIHAGVGLGTYAVPATAFGTPVTVTVTSTSIPSCTTTLSPVVGNDADNVCHAAVVYPLLDAGVTNIPFCSKVILAQPSVPMRRTER
ncbi:MAG: hypothetical protein IPI55_14960 [Flavobacteriales bacterium]|nr:hypothetical protein [Flavobacteriales bacterium]